MPVHNLRRTLREDVRIRLGVQVPAKNKKGEDVTRPEALTKFRFTAARREPLDKLAAVYGGEVKHWPEGKALTGGHEWELLSETSVLQCLIPPIPGTFSQWNELWSGGGCQRRCDGLRETYTDQPCLCPEDGRERMELAAKGQACKLSTRLTVVLRELDSLAGARLETHSYYAGSELAGAEHLYAAAHARGAWLECELALVPRAFKRGGRTLNIIVPELSLSRSETMEALGMAGPEFGQLPAAPPQDPAPQEPGKEAAAGASTGERAAASRPAPTPRAPAPVVDRERREAIAGRLRQASLTDEEAMDVIRLVTEGRAHNLGDLSELEQERVIFAADAIRANKLEVGYGIGGSDEPMWIDPSDKGAPVDIVWNDHVIAELRPTAAGSPGTTWKRKLEGTGVRQPGLLRQARTFAEELGIEVPTSIELIVDAELSARLDEWLAERKSAAAS